MKQKGWKVTAINGKTGKEHTRLVLAFSVAGALNKTMLDIEDRTQIMDLPDHWRIDIDRYPEIDEWENE